jgi:hypothetical protein
MHEIDALFACQAIDATQHDALQAMTSETPPKAHKTGPCRGRINTALNMARLGHKLAAAAAVTAAMQDKIRASEDLAATSLVVHHLLLWFPCSECVVVTAPHWRIKCVVCANLSCTVPGLALLAQYDDGDDDDEDAAIPVAPPVLAGHSLGRRRDAPPDYLALDHPRSRR